MGTPFITHLEPTRLDGYNHHLPHDQQPAHIPTAFLDAMRVREAVFVEEQGCPPEFEHDADDARSCHWVMYASVRKNVTTTTTEEEEGKQRDPDTGGGLLTPRPPRRSETTTIPIGTLRIVPFPHPPHPPDGARYIGNVLQPPDTDTLLAGVIAATVNVHNNENGPSKDDGPQSTATEAAVAADPTARHRSLSIVDHHRLSAAMPFGADRPTDFHDGKEPYVKLGRVAVVREFRGHQIAVQLWNAARKWMQENPGYFNPSVKELGMDTMKVGSADEIPKWNGLICVHAQESVVKVYERWGFQVDKRMGKFYEEGIPHVGMWQRLEVKATDPTI